MGFFTDIIRDSQGPTRRNEKAALVRVRLGSETMVPNNSMSAEPLTLQNDSLSQNKTSEKTFWEEDFKQSGATRPEVQSPRLEVRQVVGPSLSENTEKSDLSQAPEVKSSFPDIGKQKQAGLKNRRAVTVQMDRDRILHGSVSFSREDPSSKDSIVVASGAKRQEQSAREKSVNVTHRSQQAGQIIRAGTTTPPNSGKDAQAASSQDHFTQESTKKKALQTKSPEVRQIRTPVESIVSPQEEHKPQETRNERSALAKSSPAEEEGDRRVGQVIPLPDNEVVADFQSLKPPDSEFQAISTVAEDASERGPVEVRFHEQPTLESTRNNHHKEPPPEAVTQNRLGESSGPKVQIGLLEIVVMAAEKEKKTTPSISEGQNIASRHYLRNF